MNATDFEKRLTDQGEEIDNLAGLIFPEDKQGFWAGALAAMLTETGTVGQVLGTDLIPPLSQGELTLDALAARVEELEQVVAEAGAVAVVVSAHNVDNSGAVRVAVCRR